VLRPLVVSLITTVAVLALLARRVSRHQVDNVSMQPTLLPGDRLIAERLTPLRRHLQAGSIVIVRHPERPRLELVKRIAAGPGGEVRLGLNGELTWRLGADEVFVLGDNLALSTDSRAFGPVPLKLVRGRVRYRYWPPQRRGRID
jgi:signal peptidase I